MTETNQLVRIVLLQKADSFPAATEQLIKSAFPAAQIHCVHSKAAYLKSVNAIKPHIILFENCIANFLPVEALQLLKKNEQIIPFILINASNDEQLGLNLLEEGAADYIMKDRLAKLPFILKTALKNLQQQAQSQFLQQVVNNTAMVFSFDGSGNILLTNSRFTNLSGFSEPEWNSKLFQQSFSGSVHMPDLVAASANGKVWEGVLVGKTKTGVRFWLDTVIYSNTQDDSSCRSFTAVGYDITEKKLLKLQIADQQRHEKLRIAAITLAVQEKERNIIGQELHDNVNQILVGIKLLLATLINRSEGVHEYIKLCYFNIDTAIEENRKISSVLITPDFEEYDFLKQLHLLLDSMLSIAGIRIHINADSFSEKVLEKGQKLAIYRIVQEQCTNIVKYAAAGNVYLTLAVSTSQFKMTIADDGQGVSNKTAKKGIGLKNIAYRIAIFNGTVNTVSAPGCGFSLQIKMPLQQKRIVTPPDLKAKGN